jgi:hypothetical protein
MHSGTGAELTQWNQVINYAVEPAPLGERISIAKTGNSWKILRTKDGVQGNWTGDFKTAEEALASVQREFD